MNIKCIFHFSRLII